LPGDKGFPGDSGLPGPKGDSLYLTPYLALYRQHSSNCCLCMDMCVKCMSGSGMVN
jgi:hypothetical protein